MLVYILKRFLFMIPMLLGITIISFVVIHLPPGEPRCMACGGELLDVPKHAVMGEAPPLAYRHCDRFWLVGLGLVDTGRLSFLGRNRVLTLPAHRRCFALRPAWITAW